MYVFSRILREWQIFLLSLSIFTYLPIHSPFLKNSVVNNPHKKAESYKYCSMVGLLIGFFSAITYHYSILFFSKPVAISLSIFVSFILARKPKLHVFFGAKLSSSRLKKSQGSKENFSSVNVFFFFIVIMLFVVKYMVLMQVTSIYSVIVLSSCLSYSTAYSLIYTGNCIKENNKKEKSGIFVIDRKDDVIFLIFITLSILLLSLDSKLSFFLLLATFLIRVALFSLIRTHCFINKKISVDVVRMAAEVLCYVMAFISYIAH
ncbi:hypothetical protein R3X26_04625 [Vibrio sp. TH_r3]|uniref:hypothetical protein n=1 Tax=Vibrio sp. TH_r3 TaxID=3082084 RepID=UPI0029537067|nr:hypothetical protein [Vibrio sp. TH_r3]MDV7103689.1 hypothetical protein [Vibrio sp. TH_r3]